MSISKETKQSLIKDYQLSENDRGSSFVQVALLTHRIANLTEHMKQFSKDFSTQRGLLNLVSKRKKHLKFIKNNDLAKYKALIQKLGIRG